MEQERCATVLNKVRPQTLEEAHNEVAGVPDSGADASALKPSQSPFASPLSQFASTPTTKHPETEVNVQRLDSIHQWLEPRIW